MVAQLSKISYVITSTGVLVLSLNRLTKILEKGHAYKNSGNTLDIPEGQCNRAMTRGYATCPQVRNLLSASMRRN